MPSHRDGDGARGVDRRHRFGATRILNGEGRVVAALSVVVRTDSVKDQAVLPAVIASGLGISRFLGRRISMR
jgi:hypothetical protein